MNSVNLLRASTLVVLAAASMPAVRAMSARMPETSLTSSAMQITCPFTLPDLPHGKAGVPYAASAAASSGAAPYSYTVSPGALPPDLAIDPGTGAVTGTPMTPGTFAFTINASDTQPCTTPRAYNMVIGTPVAAGDLVIREFRMRGPVSATDEYVVVYNRSAVDITVSSSNSAGFAVASSNGVVLFTIPNGALIRKGGYFLGANTTAFSLGVTPDATWTPDVADGLGLALFDSAVIGGATVIDAVGIGGSTAPYLEGTALTSITTPGQHAWVRKAPGTIVQDTGNNATDFVLVATDSVIYNGVQSILGAPAPSNSTNQDVFAGMNIVLVEPNVGANTNPNRLRVTAPPDRLEFRRRIMNNSGGPIDALRLRFVEITTLNSPGFASPAQADLRPNTSSTVVLGAPTSIGVTSVTGLNLLTPPVQTLGGGWNSILNIPGGPIANGASVDVNIALRVGRVGNYLFVTTVEKRSANAAPTVTTTGGTTAFTENSPAVTIDAGVTVTDDGPNLTSATVTITNLVDAGAESLSANTAGTSIVASYSAPTLTLSGVDTVANYQAVLRTVTYNNTSDAPSITPRSIAFAVNDGALASNIAAKTVSVTPVNDAPILTAGVVLAYTENDLATVIDNTVTVTDADSANITSATVQITGNYQNGQDVLSFATIGSISGSFVAGTGTLTLTGSDTVANYQAALRTVQYNNTSENPSTLTRTVQWRANDGTAQSLAGVTSTITVTAVNDNPVLTLNAAGITFTEGNAATTLDGLLTVADADNANLTGATVSITANASANDVLACPACGAQGITPSFASPTLTLTGNVTKAAYQTALRSVTYANASQNPTTAARTLSWQINDGAGSNNLSTIVTSTITVTAVNDAPVAAPKGYSATPNMKLVGLNLSLLSGATDPDHGVNGCNVTFSIASINTGTNGTVSNANLVAGTFDFDPAPGFTGTATATYTISDGGSCGTGGVLTSAPATISISVAGPVIWFVNSAVAGPGDGRLSNPFKFIAGNAGAGNDADDVDLPGQAIFVYSGTYALPGISLLSGEALIGQGVSTVSNPAFTSFDALFGVTPPAETIARPTIAGARPVLQSGLTLATNSVLRGLNLSSGSATGVSSIGSTSGITVSQVAVTTTSGTAVLISNSTTGNFTFDGITTPGGTGVNLATANGGSTFNFSNVAITSGASNAFVATGAGTVNVTGTTNTLASTTGLALQVSNTTIGSSGVTFRSIASSGAFSGIVLNNTGSSGGFTVTGDGGGSNNGSGGVIAGSAGPGINLSSTGPINLGYMNVTTSQDDGIRGAGLASFTLNRSNITLNGNAVGERGLDLTQVGGSGGITNSTISGSAETNVRIENDTTNLTAFNVTGTTIATPSFVTGDDGILILDTGSASMTVSVTGSTFTDNKGDHFQAATDADATGPMNITFNNNTLTTTAGNDPNVIGGGITMNTSGSTDITFQINNNNIQQAFDDAININLDPGSQAGASMNGTINGNTIGTSGVSASGSESSNTITVAAKGAGLLDIDVLNNNVFEWGNQYGIFVGTTEGSAHVVAKVTGNTLHATQPNVLLINGIRVDAGATAGPPNDSGLLEIVLTGNDVTGEGNTANADADIRLRQRFGTTIKLPGYTGANNDTAAVNAFVAANNDPPGATPAPSVSSAQNVGGGGGGFIGGAATPLMVRSLGVETRVHDESFIPTQSELDVLADVARDRWAAAGLTEEQRAMLRNVKCEMADLPGLDVADVVGERIRLDGLAGGYGWFFDGTSTDSRAVRIDLLTAIMHEMGHAIGLQDRYAEGDRDDVMYGFLDPGERRLPQPGHATPHHVRSTR